MTDEWFDNVLKSRRKIYIKGLRKELLKWAKTKKNGYKIEAHELQKIMKPKYQKTLYGHENNFNLFIKIKERNLLPKVILLSGEKGIGKCTFAYHLINYLLSEQITNSEYLKNFSLDTDGKNYKLISQNCHPNFYLVEKSLDNIHNVDTL